MAIGNFKPITLEAEILNIHDWLAYQLALRDAMPERFDRLETKQIKEVCDAMDNGTWTQTIVRTTADGFTTVKDIKNLMNSCKKFGVRTRSNSFMVAVLANTTK